MDRRRPRIGAFTGYPFTGYELTGYPFTGVQFGEDTDAVTFAMIWNGEPTYYTSYTRLGVAYAESPSGSVVAVPQDVPPYEYVEGQKVHRQYEGTNIVPDSEDPSTWSLLVGATYNASLNQFTIPDGGGVSFLTETTTDYQGLTMNASAYVDIISGSEASFSLFDGVGFTLDSRTTDGLLEVERTFDATSSSIAATVGNSSGSDIVVTISKTTVSEGKLPFIPTNGTAVTVNKGTTSLLAEDINTASFLFNGSSDNISRNKLPELCKDCAFTVAMKINANDVSTEQVLLNNIFSANDLMSISFNVGSINAGIYNGSSYFVKKSGAISNGIHDIILTYNGIDTLNLYLDGVDLTGTSQPTSSVNEGFKIGSRNDNNRWYNGYIWDVRIFDRVITSEERTDYQNDVAISNTIITYPLSQYREDTFVEDTTGSNHGTASRNVNLLISENDAFGYPVNAKAREPWQYTTDDGVVVQKGLREFFGGEASGALEDSGTTTISTRYQIVTTTTDYFGAGLVAGDRFVAASSVALSAANSVREVSPAVGVVPFTSYIPHGLTTDLPLIQFTTSDFVPLYVEQTTGLIKGYDGTNTCVSASAVTAGTEVSGWFAFNADEMWITLEGTKGTITTFAGYFPDIGNRVFGMTDGTYQTIRHLYFENELAFDSVFDSGEQVVDGSDIVIEYT